MGSCDATLAHYGTKMGLLEGLPGQHEHELRWANMSTSAVAAASLVAVPGGYGGLSGKQRGLADAGGTYAGVGGLKSYNKVKLDMFTAEHSHHQFVCKHRCGQTGRVTLYSL